MFKELDKQVELENKLIKEYEEENLLGAVLENNKDKEKFVFFEGPPTANGKPGIHHVIARTLKDSICRYKSMKGYYVKRKAGWDTHGLPVEIEVEKNLDIHTKKEIEDFGIARFNEECRNSVFKYESMWRDMTKKMGYMIDLDDPYITLDNDYIESVFNIIKKFFDKGLIYEGHKILPYCPRCGTGLASHEVSLGYKEVKTNTVVVAFKRKNKDEYFLAWTTTPWTLLSNVSLSVGKDMKYIKARMLSEDELKQKNNVDEIKDDRVKNFGNKILYVSKGLADSVLGNYEILEELKGSDLEKIEYEQLLDFINIDDYKKPNQNSLFITLADYVKETDGTGIIHTAPAFGEDDYNTGVKYNLPVVNPVDEEGKYKEGPFKGRFVLEEGLDVEIIKVLASKGVLFSKEKFEHNYPFCWRCQTPLIYYSKPSWYIKVTDFKDELIKNNDTVNWFPDFIGEKRFSNWLLNLNDWAISRSRYWGTPLMIFRCDKCGELKVLGSRKDIEENNINENLDVKNMDLHRPYVDDIVLKCKCGSELRRVPDVLDCWFDSGAMPFAQYHFPFENEEEQKNQFPADFICEGIDQTRGWFYSLLVIGTFVKGVAPYKNVLVNDLILDKDGKKMSKSKGNAVDPFLLFEKYGADIIRFYLLFTSPAWAPTKFDEDGVKEVISKFFSTLRNSYQFFSLYANIDKVDTKTLENISLKDIKENKNTLDLFILSKLNNLIKNYEENFDSYYHIRVLENLLTFLDEDFSNWYIRRSRTRFFSKGLDNDKMAAYKTTYIVLTTFVKLLAPISPFISDEIFKKLTLKKSVHLEIFDKADDDLIDNKLEELMSRSRTICTLARSIRERENIKVRQPIKEIMLSEELKENFESYLDIIKEEINVKEVNFIKNIEEFVNFKIVPNFKTAGKVLGKHINEFMEYLSNVNTPKFINEFESFGVLKLEFGGEFFEIKKDYFEVKLESKSGFSQEASDNIIVILDTKITDELREEGLVREFISKVQQTRKNLKLDILDRIEIYYECKDENCIKTINKFCEQISNETLANNIFNESNDGEIFDLNGVDVKIVIIKSS